MTHRGGNRSLPPPVRVPDAAPLPPLPRHAAHPLLPFSISRASPRHVLPLPRGDADVDMRLRHAYAAAFGIGLCAANHRRET